MTPNIAAATTALRRSVGLAVIALLATACNKSGPSDKASPAPAADDPAMSRGLDQLYKANAPAAAVASFRDVLNRNPTHYGATFQLAKALDVAGQPDSARVWWTKFSSMAEAIKDTQSLAVTTARLAQPDTVSQAAMMQAGLDLLFRAGNPDPVGAADKFRMLLTRNPTHYGAHFQLARALDFAGQPAEARQWWSKVLKLATDIKDQTTADTAKARLARQP